MGKRSDRNLLHLICFILFVVWGLGTLLNLILGWCDVNFAAAGIVNRILSMCATLVMVYCAYLYYDSHKTDTVKVLFWISVIVAVAVVILPWLI